MRKSTNKNTAKKTVRNENVDVVMFGNETIGKTKPIDIKEDDIVEQDATEVSEVQENKIKDKKTPKEEISTWDKKFRYQMLDRMRQDCDYYLNGHDTVNQLYADSEAEQIEYMLAIWDSFDDRDKPRWLSREEIIEYAKKMGVEM